MPAAGRVAEYTTFISSFYPDSIWADSLMMYALFAVEWGAYQGDKALYEFGLAQPGIFAGVLQDPGSGLFKHAWHENMIFRLRPGPAQGQLELRVMARPLCAKEFMIKFGLGLRRNAVRVAPQEVGQPDQTLKHEIIIAVSAAQRTPAAKIASRFGINPGCRIKDRFINLVEPGAGQNAGDGRVVKIVRALAAESADGLGAPIIHDHGGSPVKKTLGLPYAARRRHPGKIRLAGKSRQRRRRTPVPRLKEILNQPIKGRAGRNNGRLSRVRGRTLICVKNQFREVF
ncbi:MAG: glycoside hydrolase family 88 protein [Elusimicrobia bacterium]|nr:glycoside hydrolase family 88 protein [Elusimicrobiota bacterium]